MSLSNITFYLPFRRFQEDRKEAFESALRTLLSRTPGAEFRVVAPDFDFDFAEDDEDDDDPGIEYQLRLPGGKRGHQGVLLVHEGDDESPARLELPNDRDRPVQQEIHEIAAALVQKLGGWAEDDDHAAHLLQMRQRPVRTWDDVVVCAADHYLLESQPEGWFTVLVDPEEMQEVGCSLMEDEGGQGWLVLRTPACPADVLSPKDALEKNAELDFASLALLGDIYELIYTFPLDALTWQGLGDLLRWMAEDAIDLRDELADGEGGAS